MVYFKTFRDWPDECLPYKPVYVEMLPYPRIVIKPDFMVAVFIGERLQSFFFISNKPGIGNLIIAKTFQFCPSDVFHAVTFIFREHCFLTGVNSAFSNDHPYLILLVIVHVGIFNISHHSLFVCVSFLYVIK